MQWARYEAQGYILSSGDLKTGSKATYFFENNFLFVELEFYFFIMFYLRHVILLIFLKDKHFYKHWKYGFMAYKNINILRK
jgi:hypothetical protein